MKVISTKVLVVYEFVSQEDKDRFLQNLIRMGTPHNIVYDSAYWSVTIEYPLMVGEREVAE